MTTEHDNSDFNAEELALMGQLEADSGADHANYGPGDMTQEERARQAQANAGAATTDADAEVSNQGAEQVAEAKPDEAEAETGPSRRATRDALRAARHGEAKWRAEADKLRKENERLAASQPAQTGEADADISAIEVDFPEVAAQMKKEREARLNAEQQLAALRQGETQAAEFEPPALHPDTQAIVDGLPDLLAWQYDPQNRDAWDAACLEAAKLQKLPGWKDKPEEEQLKEVARRVKAELAQAAGDAPPDPKAQAAQRIAQTPLRTPQSIGGLRGTAAPEANTEPDYARMTDDEIINSLLV